MLKLLRRKSFRKSKEFNPSSRQSNLNSSSGSVVSGAGGQYFARSRPHRRSRTSINPNPEQGGIAGVSQNSLDRKSIGSHRYSSVNLGSPVPAPEIIQYSRPPENLTSPVRDSIVEEQPPSKSTGGGAAAAASSSIKAATTTASSRLSKMMNIVTSSVPQEETAARLRTASVMPTPRCLPPTPTRSHRSGGHVRGSTTSGGGGSSLPPTAQALPMVTPNVVSSSPTSADVVVPKPSARMSLRNKVKVSIIKFWMGFSMIFHILLWARSCKKEQFTFSCNSLVHDLVFIVLYYNNLHSI